MSDTRDIQTQSRNESNVQQQPQQQSARRVAAQDDRAMVPRVDVLEDESGITLLADLPGVPREQLELKVEGDTLLIEGTVAAPTPEQLEPLYAEVRLPRYRRAFTLSRELDTGAIQAQLRDGVLNLRIPKQAHAQPRRIEVQVG
ncbi:Hsp20/alpha crystallin family protein [Azohydromonas australica]|uniref:Hsp20/alpha crystallin family protein n=1 Tax=Azohydromonas australica TaxID=364039 RepID=UPI0003F9C8DD|nr:Hsp20/alpha crystallin family protein [Azohydromonas australica]